MRILVIDTSGPVCAAGLFDAETARLVAHRSETLGKGHAERLIPMIEAVFADAGTTLDTIDRIATTTGPGSFTGIRVGVATARGLGLALDVPVDGISTLSVLAGLDRRSGLASSDVLCVIDAKRDEVFVQPFDQTGHPIADAQMLDYADTAALARSGPYRLVGSAVGLPGLEEGVAMPDLWPLDVIGEISAAGGLAGAAKPLYLRGAGAKPQTGFAVARA